MKAKFYVDVYPGTKISDLMPQNCTDAVPIEKIGECRRYFFELDFPGDEDTSLGVVEKSAEPPKEGGE